MNTLLRYLSGLPYRIKEMLFLVEIDVVHPFMGGNVIEKHAGSFVGQNRDTGEPETITWVDCVQVTGGKGKPVKLNGTQVRGLVKIYHESEEFQEWCTKCL